MKSYSILELAGLLFLFFLIIGWFIPSFKDKILYTMVRIILKLTSKKQKP